jgi:tRNA A-37 threonylcarbamoyl transferase component Bud32
MAQDTQQLHAFAADLADSRAVAGWHELNCSDGAKVAHHGEQNIYFKCFLPRGPLERLKAWLRGSRATRARRNNIKLLQYGFEAPTDLAWGRLNGGREYLYSSAVAGAGVTQWLRETLTSRDPEQLKIRRKLLRELGRFVGRLHHSGFIHGDLRPNNVLAHRSDQRFSFALIDNERNSSHEQAPGKLLQKNLMQLNMLLSSDLTNSDRWRFYLAWRRQMPELSDLEARLLAVESYLWARRRLDAKGLL